MPSHTESESHEVDVHWDGSPLTKQAWYDDLPRQVRKHRPLWERGFVSQRGVIYTSSPTHSYHISINNIETCTFAKPCPLRSFRLEDPSEATKTLSESKAKQYVDEPTQLDEGDKNFFEDLIANIDNKQRRKDYRASTKGSGIAMLMQLTAEIDKMNDDLSAWAVEHRAKLVLRGLTAPTVVAFDQFREAYENYTNQMGSRAEPESVTAKVYITAARDLGDLTATKLDLRLEVVKPTTLAATVELITDIITKIETTGARPGTGHTRAAPSRQPTGDPQRDRFYDADGKRIYIRGADDECTICAAKGKVGHHLIKNCADFKPREKPRERGGGRAAGEKETPRKAKGGAKAAGGGDVYEDASAYDTKTEGVDISGADIALSELFSSGTQSVTLETRGAETQGTGGHATGSARAAAGRERPPPQESDDEELPDEEPERPAVASVPPAPLSPRTPSFLPLPAARRRVSALTPESPMADFRSVTADTGSDVSMRTGGVDHRNRYRILEEMRAEIGLPPMPVPTGLPVATPRLGDDLEQTQVELALEASAPARAAPPPAPAPAPPVPPAPPAPTPVGGRPVALPGMPGRTFTLEAAVTSVTMQRRADGAGGLQHAYTITHDGQTVTAVCPSAGPVIKPVAPAGAILIGSADRDVIWASAGVLVLTRVVDVAPAAPPSGAPSSFSFSLLAIAGLLTVIAYLLAVIAGVGGVGAGGHSAIAAPFHDPGTWLAAARAFGHHASLRAVLGHLLGCLVRGYTVIAACACATWHLAMCLGRCAHAAHVCLIPLLSHGLAAVATPIGAVAAVVTATALITAAAAAVWRTSRNACTATFTLGMSLRGGVPLHFILPKLLPRRLTAALGRVFPQIPPTGYSTSDINHPTRWARTTGRAGSQPCAPLIHRTGWQSRFHHLRQRCRDDTVRAPRAAPWQLLPLLLQLAVVSALDLGARATNLRTTPAGTPPHGPIVNVPVTSARERTATAFRRAASTARMWRRSARRACCFTALLATVITAQLLLSIRREPHLPLRAADELAGWLIGRHACHAVLYALHVTTHAARLAAHLSYLSRRWLLTLLMRTVYAYLTLTRWVHHVKRAISYLAVAARTGILCLLLLAELRGRGGSTGPRAVAMPRPSRVESLPPAVVATVSQLVGPSCAPVLPDAVESAHVSAHSGVALSARESGDPERKTAKQAPHVPREGADPPLARRVGYALRRSKRQGCGDAKAAAKQLDDAPAWRSSHRVARWARLVVDSGCTWHVHNRLEDLHNVRDCADVVVDANGNEVTCPKVGDLLVVARDSRKREFKIWLKGVRFSPTFEDTLISVDQLWSAARIDAVFRDVRALICTQNVDTTTGDALSLPFARLQGLYRWQVGVLDEKPADATSVGNAFGLKSNIHAAGSHTHLRALPADDVAATLHRRLHVSLDRLRRLGHRSADAPPHVAAATTLSCPICAEANSRRVAHGQSQYQPTHAGRLVHADIVGPFTTSFNGGYKYALILVDDHTRFKFVHFLKAKSEAPDRVRTFIASMNAHASSRSTSPVRIVGSLHTDNAGEFLSRQFTELLDTELVSQTTCPPHVHQLNGVAERAIQSIMTLARSYLTLSNVATTHWPHALEMAVDVLNRTGGPTADTVDGPTSYELLTGERPRVLGIMPFGCRAYAVKPREQYSKTTIDPRAWVGLNLGRSSKSPGAYKIYVPSIGRIVVTSDAYFEENFYPMRARGDHHVDIDSSPPPTVPPADDSQPPGPPAQLAGSALSMATAFSDAVRSTAPASRRVLILFSGPYDRPDGLAAFLRRRGLDVDLVDSSIDGGGEEHDILNDAFFVNIYDKVRAGTYFAIFAAPPCSTYSVARFFRGKDDSGPPIVRERDSILGITDVPKGHKRELHHANEITRRTTILLTAGYRAGCEFALENPADRGDPTMPWLFQVASHGPIWLDPHMITMYGACALEEATFAQCMFGADVQKYSTLWFTPGLAPHLHSLQRLLCTHSPGTHGSVAGGVQLPSGTWNSASSSAYPTDLNLFLAEAFMALRLVQEASPDATPDARRGPPAPHRGTDADAAVDAQPAPSPAPEEAPQPLTTPPSPTPPITTPHSPAPPDAAEPAEAEDTNPSPAPPRRRGQRRRPEEHFQRGGGAIHTRSRGAVSLAKGGPDDPTNHPDAMRRDPEGWGAKGAEGAEIDNHEKNGSWRYILRSEMPRGRHTVKLTWVFKVKRDGRKKARLCVQGCTQRPGVDYDQTFCAAMRAGSLRLLSAIGGRLGLHMRRWDFVAAYLQGSLEPGEVTYCTPPPGYGTAEIDGRVRLVPIADADGVDRLCLVVKPVYGMAQAGRRWQRSLFPWLKAWNERVAAAPRLVQSVFDSCVFFCHHDVDTPHGKRRELLLVGCYVDDLFVLSSHNDEYSLYHQFTSDLSKRWDVEDEGEVTDLLSVEISREDEHVVLRQAGYISKLLATYAPDGVPASPLGSSYPLTAHQSSRAPADAGLPKRVLVAVEQDASDIDPVLLKAYQSLVGALLYCAVNTRPDVSYAVGMLCRAMGKPTPDLYLDALRVLYYLHHHQYIGLRYGASDLDMAGMSDSDWAVRHSTTGYVFTYAMAAISWGSKKQDSVALSSCEAEIVALSEAGKESVHLSRFLNELGFGAKNPPQLATDNSGARDLSYNPEHHDRVKHVERRHFWIRELVEQQQLVVPFVSTHANLADFFTKPLEGNNFFRLRNIIMNVSADDRARASLARRERRRASDHAAPRSAGGDVGMVEGEPCYACELAHARVDSCARRAHRVSFALSAPVRCTGGCRETCSHTHGPTLPVSRVVAPSHHHAPIGP